MTGLAVPAQQSKNGPDAPVFFVGPRKTGTTAFYEILERGRLPLPANVKETFFFEQEEPNLAVYADRFGVDPDRPFGEVSPSYFSSPVARANLARLFPGARIVITLRDPVARALSAVRHMQRLGSLPPRMSVGEMDSSKHVRNMIHASSYELQWAHAFPGLVAQVKQGGDGRYDQAALHRLGDFLGLDAPLAQAVEHQANPARTARSPLVARWINRTKIHFRRMGAYRTMRALKTFEPLFFRAAGQGDSAEGGEFDRYFRERLASSLHYFEQAGDIEFL